MLWASRKTLAFRRDELSRMAVKLTPSRKIALKTVRPGGPWGHTRSQAVRGAVLGVTAFKYNGVTNRVLFQQRSNLINYFCHRCNAVIVTDNVKWRVTTIWLNEACGVILHTSCVERAGAWG